LELSEKTRILATNTMLTELVVNVLPVMITVHYKRGREDEQMESSTKIAALTLERDSLNETLHERLTSVSVPVERPTYEDASTETDVVSRSSSPCSPCSPTTNDTTELTREIVQLKASVERSTERATQAEERETQSVARELEASTVFEEHMETLRSETVQQLELSRTDAETARATGTLLQEQRNVLESENTKLRDHARDAQERTVDVHRTTLEELRRRDTQMQSMTEMHHREQLESCAKTEGTSVENRALKRRIDELLTSTEEMKRMRTGAQRVEVDRARDEAERDALKEQLTTLRHDNDMLRRDNVEVQNRLAVLQATAKLESCRRSLNGK